MFLCHFYVSTHIIDRIDTGKPLRVRENLGELKARIIVKVTLSFLIQVHV